jgi:hypothetical protein
MATKSSISAGTTSTSTNFEAIFNDALAEYTKQTKKDLRNLPISSEIDGCKSAESITKIFRDQAKAFDDFRNGDRKLIKCLDFVVDRLYALATSPVLNTIVGLASPSEFSLF